MLTNEQVAAYGRDGYVIDRGFFNAEEMEVLRAYAQNDPALQNAMQMRADAGGGVAKLSLWNEAGDDLYGVVSRTEKLVDACEQLVGEEIYHWHHKMSMKEPFTGGAWEWHQDYGYWYKNYCLFPNLISAFIAVDKCTRENGCMQVITGSHKMGRVEHGRFGDQTGADPERVEEALKVLPLDYAVMEPGDVLFFHSNTLHRSDQNTSPDRRWSLICCYNARSNSPFAASTHPAYTKLERLPNSALVEAGRRMLAERA